MLPASESVNQLLSALPQVDSRRDPPAPVRVLVADAHSVVRAGLKALIGAQPGLLLVGETGDGPSAVALAAGLDPDVVVLDVDLPGLDGAHVAARLRGARPDRKVLVLTAHERAVRLMLSVGVQGYALKASPTERLARALRTVAEGGTYIDPKLAGAVVGTDSDSGARLSVREVEVLRLLALGYGNKQVAAKLKLSAKTIETYKGRAMEKLELRSRVDIVRYAVRHGWLAVDAPAPSLVSHSDSRTSTFPAEAPC